MWINNRYNDGTFLYRIIGYSPMLTSPILYLAQSCYTGADPGLFKMGGGSILGLQAKKKRGGGLGGGGGNFGPNVKKTT